jgi:molybdenum cofactor cytidylyltransferase
MKVAALVLAAGSSTRFDGLKQLAPWGDTTLLGQVLRDVASWPVDETWVVLGAEAEEILEQVDFGDATVVINESFRDGISTSLKVGVDAIQRETRVDAILIVLGDQPGVPDDVPGALIEAMVEEKFPAIRPKYRYDRGNPVLVGRLLWERLLSLEGDEGARGFFAAHPELVREVWFDVLAPRDIDTPKDYEQYGPRPQ